MVELQGNLFVDKPANFIERPLHVVVTHHNASKYIDFTGADEIVLIASLGG